MTDYDREMQDKRPFLFQVKSEIHGKELTSLYLIYARRAELRSILDEYLKTLYGAGEDIVNGYYLFDGGAVRCRVGRIGILNSNIADMLAKKGLVLDISNHTKPKTYDELRTHLLNTENLDKKRGTKMSGRLHIKNFKTCIRCSSSIITGKPSIVDPAWNSAHLYNSLESEEQSFRDMHCVPRSERLNISWAVPVTDEIVKGEGRCEFCNSYCEKIRTIVSMIVIL